MWNLITLFGVMLVLISCTVKVPMYGHIENSEETFTGTVTASTNRTGNFIMILKDVTCKGHISYVNRREGEGRLNCDDGRIGSFKLVSTSLQATGYGELDGKPFTVKFINKFMFD